MKPEIFLEQLSPDPDLTDAKQALRVIIAYHDPAAGDRAMRLLANLGHGLGGDVEFQPRLWSFDLLADPNLSDFAAGDTAVADMLIISTSGPNPLAEEVQRWVEQAISRMQASASAVVAIFGPEEDPDQAGSLRWAAIKAAAARAGLEFFVPTPRDELDEAIARIHQRAAAVTPLLGEILQQQSSRRWEQNAWTP